MASLKVLNAFAGDPDQQFCGSDLMDALGMASGTLYPILLRLEREGLLNSKWEKADAKDLRRPRRRLYKITGSGMQAARDALLDLGFQLGFGGR